MVDISSDIHYLYGSDVHSFIRIYLYILFENQEVDNCLRIGSSGKNVMNIEFRHDCFNYLFNVDQISCHSKILVTSIFHRVWIRLLRIMISRRMNMELRLEIK